VDVIATLDTQYDVNAVAAGPDGLVVVGGQDHFVHHLRLDVGKKTLTEFGMYMVLFCNLPPL
jgi:hypothetical protein